MKEIQLTKGQVAIVDDDDYEWLNSFKWHASHDIHGSLDKRDHWYAVRTGAKLVSGKRPFIRMHRLIMGITDPKIPVDHDNHNGLDNRRANLRVASPPNNAANQRKRKADTLSQYKGVTWWKATSKWRAQIKVNQKNRHLGLFEDEVDAAKAYNLAALEAWGEFAYLNEVS